MEGLVRLSLSNLYNSLLNKEIDSFISYSNGHIASCDRSLFSYASETHLFPGSYNPLHEGHRGIYDQIREDYYKVKLYEISIERYGKENLTLEEIKSRLGQFNGYANILITNAPRIVQKAGLFYNNNLIVHVGIDTYDRMIQDYGVIGVQGISSSFVVYDRKIDGQIQSIKDRKMIPSNCSVGVCPKESLLGISSTNIRKGIK